MIAFLISAGIIFLLSALIYIGSHVVAFIFGGLCLLALVVTTIAVSGALQTFNWAAITLGYEEVRGKPDNA
jgi:amino acid transporter